MESHSNLRRIVWRCRLSLAKALECKAHLWRGIVACGEKSVLASPFSTVAVSAIGETAIGNSALADFNCLAMHAYKISFRPGSLFCVLSSRTCIISWCQSWYVKAISICLSCLCTQHLTISMSITLAIQLTVKGRSSCWFGTEVRQTWTRHVQLQRDDSILSPS